MLRQLEGLHVFIRYSQGNKTCGVHYQCYCSDSLGSYHEPLAPPPPDDPPLNPPKLDPPLNPPELELLLNPLLEYDLPPIEKEAPDVRALWMTVFP